MSKSNNVCLISGSLNIKNPWSFLVSKQNERLWVINHKWLLCDYTENRGDVSLQQKHKHKKKKKKTQNKLKLHFLPSTLFDLVSARRLFTQISPIMFPSCIWIRQAAPEHLPCTDSTGSYATPEHCVMTEPLPGTHYRRVRYGAGYFSQPWTNRYWPCWD